ncbi:hypothetical protein KNP414_00840 [Paenibacillus mucilaginosus KNP414]|uniref:Uncharacterized protein n=1 Tax=Paenibacillus mucilaginosus (strain KNP414) TaxID=1036673 RepID=F8F4N8_PAEMK|nr:hypothetical protein KNP414_00840 [Paenibacillus mucilaginosus KNP414]
MRGRRRKTLVQQEGIPYDEERREWFGDYFNHGQIGWKSRRRMIILNRKKESS